MTNTNTTPWKLVSYYCPTGARTLLPYVPTSSVLICLQTDKPRTDIPCKPIRSHADMPTEPTLIPYCHRQVPAYDHEYCTVPIRTCQEDLYYDHDHRTDRIILPNKPKILPKTPILDQNRLFYTKNRGYFLGGPRV